MFTTLMVHVRGKAPLLHHNGRLADPLNPFAKRLKELTSKRKKTDADYEAIAIAEWQGGIYNDEEGRPIVPGENIEAGIVEAAKSLKLGKTAKIAILSDGDWPILYDGPKTIDKLQRDPRFRDTRGVKNPGSGARVMRTRPIFRMWELKFELMYDDEEINEGQVLQILEILGRKVGFLDFRPKYGRFVVVSVTAA